ncbi:MAG: DUF885 family protein [Planctomycetes bacterium]|nr:DUF885 family protein [Planctomycetota bacterium]
MNQFLKGWLKLNPIISSAIGLEEHMDTLIPETADVMKDRINYLKSAKRDLAKIKPLSGHESRDLKLALYLADKWLIELEDIRYWGKSPSLTEYSLDSLYPLIAIDYAPLQERMIHLYKRMSQLPKRLKEIWHRVDSPVVPLLELELEAVTRIPGFFYYLQELAREGTKAKIYKEIKKLSEKCLNEIESMYHHLIVRILSKCKNMELMERDIYDKYLQHLLQTKDIPSVVATAEVRLDQLNKKLQSIGNKIARRQTVDMAISVIKEQRSSNIQELIQVAKGVVSRSFEFATDNAFCKMSSGDTLYVLEEPSFYVQYNPLYLYKNGGVFSKSGKGFLFLAPPDCDLDKIRELNNPLVTALTTRYGYPGEHLYFMLNKGKMSLLDAVNDAGFTIAGWREYSSIKFNELGFEDTVHHSFMNTMALARATVKFITEIKLFRGDLKSKEAVAYLARHSCFDWTITESEIGVMLTHPGRELYSYYGYESICKLENVLRKKVKAKFKQNRFNNYIISLLNYPAHMVPDSSLPLDKFNLPDQIAEKERGKVLSSSKK